jgi:hypothetical protein
MAQNPSLAPLSSLARPPYDRLVAYPTGDPDEVKSRIRQLQEMKITCLDFQGRLKNDRLSVLGKGVVGIVVIGVMGSRRIAVKIRRVDARRPSLIHEAELLKIANSLSVAGEPQGEGAQSSGQGRGETLAGTVSANGCLRTRSWRAQSST